MNIELVRSYCLSKPGTTEDSAFGPEGILFRICGKIYAYLDLERPDQVVLKCNPDYAISLRDRYAGISGAWHWNKKHWNEVHFEEGISDKLVYELIDHSYSEVVNTLPKKLLYHFPDLPEGWKHTHLDCVDSTMNYLRCEPDIPSPFNLVTADFQTAGRGQRGTSWEADKGVNLLFGFKFHPTWLRADRQFLLSEALALAVAQSLEKYAGKSISIKWPNDIYCGDRKICGMLLEHDLCGAHIATTLTGIGINVNQRQFCSQAPNPVSLYQLLGKEVDRAAILRNVLRLFTEYYRQLLNSQTSQIEKAYLKRLYRAAGYYPYRDANGCFEAQIESVCPNGQLVLRDSQGQQRIYAFKEVAFVLPDSNT